jgi:XTP/dITP diphosphohydrolase
LHKLREIREIFGAPNLELLSLDDCPALPEVEEDGATFVANAVKKAVTLALASRQWTLADDSGLEVEALGGAPGVRSARFAGEPANYEANNRRLLRDLAGMSDRRARFRCAIALASARGHAQVVEGTCGGRIAEEPRGAGGFGYDPLFVPDGRQETFAEMDPAEKNRISHRGVALAAARRAWAAALESAEELADFPSGRRASR